MSYVLGEPKHYAIFITSSPGNFIPVNGSLTLEQVNEKYWKVNKPLEMYYGVEKPKEESWIRMGNELMLYTELRRLLDARGQTMKEDLDQGKNEG